ncbi:DNA primase [Dokdonia pacifica]|uniref:DNA primase n=1 Tax=Dokdonia pacifica TaxID=1627892 RepID=A0A239CAL6_9FLAO|nr:DNA primase [Dokdonia pacifica]GGG25941.1 DNA primase [Dokdonia pacifica]SNS17130.1 DNA primase [Dokdonia pacifica]
MISKETIDKVFETARVEEVIGDFVVLKKSGSNFKGLSPFSDERTPSFMVSPVKQIWKDFSSGKGGNSVAFLMEHEHFTYPEAIKYLAKKYNIEVEETEQSDEQKEQATIRENLYVVSEYARDYYHNTLLNAEQGKAIGGTYFKERGFTPDTIKKFQLGYNPDQWDAFTSEAIRKGYKLEFLEKTGLTIVKEEKQFDRFKGRVMFPIHSMSGRVLGFGGRILTSDKKAAKYLNSPESDIYHKSKVLYGIYYAKQSIAKEDNCYLVEGYTDVIQMHQSGIENVVSSSGTALTPEQIRLINRLTNNITVLFDGDAAGQRAAIRGIDLILEQGMNVKVCSFPEGEDPDSFSRKHSQEEILAYFNENAKDFIQYKANLLVEEAAGDPIKKASTVRDMVESISKIPDTIKREIYVQECSRIMEVSESVLYDTLAQIFKKNKKEAVKKEKTATASEPLSKVPDQMPDQIEKVDMLYELERKLIEALLVYGQEEEDFEDLVLKETEDGNLELEPVVSKARVFEKIYLDLQDDEVAFTNDLFRSLYAKIIEKLHQDDQFRIETFINDLAPEEASEISNIILSYEKYDLHRWVDREVYVKTRDKSIAQFVSEIVLSLRGYLISKKIHDLSTEVSSTASNSELLSDIRDYINLKKLIHEKLGRVFSAKMG